MVVDVVVVDVVVVVVVVVVVNSRQPFAQSPFINGVLAKQACVAVHQALVPSVHLYWFLPAVPSFGVTHVQVTCESGVKVNTAC